jgi:hypothetical protein
MMDEENCVQDPDDKGYRSLGKLFQGSVRYTVWAKNLADLEPLTAS